MKASVFDFARDIADDPDSAESIVSSVDTSTIDYLWYMLTSAYNEAKRVRREAERREIDLLLAISVIQKELAARLDDADGP